MQWIAKSVLVYKSLNLSLPDDCLMQPDFGGILKSVSLLRNWQMSGLIASRAVNVSLQRYDQNLSGVHTASCSVVTVGSAGA